MLLGKLALIGLVPVAGFGIAYPIINKINSSQKEGIDYSKNTCLLIVEGESDNSDNTKQFLVCKNDENSAITFYLYDRTSKDKQEVTKLKVTSVEGNSLQKKVTFTTPSGAETAEKGKEETISLTNPWEYEEQMDLKSECKIDWRSRTMTCSKGGASPKKEKVLKIFTEKDTELD